MEQIKHPGLVGVGGMKLPKWDPRRFSWKKKFGAVAELPTQDFDVWTPIDYKDQGYTNVCTACMATSAGEAQFKTALDECFQYAATKNLAGRVDDQGCDPVTAIKASMKRGFLRKEVSPFNIKTTPVMQLADLKNYSLETVLQAATSMETSFYEVDACADIFDSMRSAMWQSVQGNFHTPMMTGAKWRSSWLNSPGGIIRIDNPQEPYTLHAFVIIGQKTINGELRLKAHLSSGPNVGDHGEFYFNREQVNKFLYAYAYAPGAPADYQVQYWTIAQKIWNLLLQLKNMVTNKVGDLVGSIIQT